MKKKLLASVVCFLSGFSSVANADSLSPQMRNQVEATMSDSVACWNKGDLQCFMNYYVKSDDLLFISGQNFIHGWDNIYARYKARYGDNTKHMGQLKLTINGMQQLGESHVFLYGQFHLEVESKKYDGVTSLVLVKSADKWKIQTDHSN